MPSVIVPPATPLLTSRRSASAIVPPASRAPASPRAMSPRGIKSTMPLLPGASSSSTALSPRILRAALPQGTSTGRQRSAMSPTPVMRGSLSSNLSPQRSALHSLDAPHQFSADTFQSTNILMPGASSVLLSPRTACRSPSPSSVRLAPTGNCPSSSTIAALLSQQFQRRMLSIPSHSPPFTASAVVPPASHRPVLTASPSRCRSPHGVRAMSPNQCGYNVPAVTFGSCTALPSQQFIPSSASSSMICRPEVAGVWRSQSHISTHRFQTPKLVPSVGVVSTRLVTADLASVGADKLGARTGDGGSPGSSTVHTDKVWQRRGDAASCITEDASSSELEFGEVLTVDPSQQSLTNGTGSESPSAGVGNGNCMTLEPGQAVNFSALREAVRDNNIDKVRALLAARADAGYESNEHRLSVMALAMPDTEVFELLKAMVLKSLVYDGSPCPYRSDEAIIDASSPQVVDARQRIQSDGATSIMTDAMTLVCSSSGVADDQEEEPHKRHNAEGLKTGSMGEAAEAKLIVGSEAVENRSGCQEKAVSQSEARKQRGQCRQS